MRISVNTILSVFTLIHNLLEKRHQYVAKIELEAQRTLAAAQAERKRATKAMEKLKDFVS